MKKFKFRLDSVLKLREFEEYKERVELGKINKEINAVKELILTLESDIVTTFYNQELNMQRANKEIDSRKDKVQAQDLQIYAYSLESYRKHIQDLKQKAEELQKTYSFKLKDLIEKRNKVKMLKSLKEKSYRNYMKEYWNQENNQIEDIVNINYAATLAENK